MTEQHSTNITVKGTIRNQDYRAYGTCSCGWTGQWFKTREGARDDSRQHVQYWR